MPTSSEIVSRAVLLAAQALEDLRKFTVSDESGFQDADLELARKRKKVETDSVPTQVWIEEAAFMLLVGIRSLTDGVPPFSDSKKT